MDRSVIPNSMSLSHANDGGSVSLDPSPQLRLERCYKGGVRGKAVLLLLMLFSLSRGGIAPSVYAQDDVSYIARLGLFDSQGGNEHTHSDGTQFSAITLGFTESGYLGGYSYRYNGGASDMGQSVWLGSAVTGVTTHVGLYDAEHTQNTGLKYSNSNQITESGYVRGYANRYNGGSAGLGFSAWVASAVTGITTRVGFYDAEHTSSTGYQYSDSNYITESGYVVGRSFRYNGGTGDRGQTAWVASADTGITTRVGFYDAEHTSNTGVKYSTYNSTSQANYVSGVSYRYNSGAVDMGQSAWLASMVTGTTTRVGLYDAEHTSSSGYKRSYISRPNMNNYVSGHSTRYNGGAADLGQSAWFASALTGTTTRVGLYDAEHTRDTGYQFSSAFEIGESDYLTGYSFRYNGGAADMGQSAWVASAVTGVTTSVGLYDAEHTSNPGYKNSFVHQLTESGYMRGYSQRYNGGFSQIGQSIWVASTATGVTTRVGLYDAEHTRSTGTKHSISYELTESGYVRGLSYRYNGGSADMGQSAWVASAVSGATTRVGLYDAEHTRFNGYKYSLMQQLTESGYMRGYSQRYDSGSPQIGQSAWVASAVSGVTTRVGLYDADHTHSTGQKYSVAQQVTESGYVRGYSNLYNGPGAFAQSAWVASAVTGVTTRVGLFDHLVHQRADGYQFSTVTGLTNSGYAWGNSERYHGDYVQDGQTAWMYRISDNLQVDFELSVRSSDGYAHSFISGITEKGLVYGSYIEFDGSGNDMGSRAFLWTEVYGTIKLSDELRSTIDLYGWNNLLSATDANEDGYLIGLGDLAGLPAGSRGVYVAFSVPEPSYAMLMMMGLITLCVRRGRFGI